ncbi:hypothetical protein [Streptomyces sp. S.PB5]|uniref:hypothetical protein n=1 Tax=Streptomyces sp. S.PB5 TaxID=3020844 RepID=UPI0025AFC980|nr:hypothetical protein [Streptomyces sp. S.PB5]MDN3028069.1 hypothetical protein [Streptomyces sp. S.PB5]
MPQDRASTWAFRALGGRFAAQAPATASGLGSGAAETGWFEIGTDDPSPAGPGWQLDRAPADARRPVDGFLDQMAGPPR